MKQIDEATLDEIAFAYYCDDCRYCKEASAVTMQDRREVCMSTRCPGRTYRWQLMHGFKAGYLEAMEDATEQKAIDIESFKKWAIDNSYIPFDFYNDTEGIEEDRVISFSDLMDYLKAMEE